MLVMSATRLSRLSTEDTLAVNVDLDPDRLYFLILKMEKLFICYGGFGKYFPHNKSTNVAFQSVIRIRIHLDNLERDVWK